MKAFKNLLQPLFQSEVMLCIDDAHSIDNAHFTDPVSSVCFIQNAMRGSFGYTAFRAHLSMRSSAFRLYWLRIPERISFKLAVLTYRAIHGAGPSYFQSCFTCVADMSSGRRLRSSGSDRLHVPIIRRSTVGSRTFTASGAAVWNDLPAYVTAAPSLAVFRRRLKTFLFSAHTLTLSLKLCIRLLYPCGATITVLFKPL